MQQVLDATGMIIEKIAEGSKRWTKHHMTQDVCEFMKILTKVIPGMTEVIAEKKGDDDDGWFAQSE